MKPSEAIRACIDNSEWQIGEIRAALKEADSGDFASDKALAALARKWKVGAAWMVAQGPAQLRLHRCR